MARLKELDAENVVWHRLSDREKKLLMYAALIDRPASLGELQDNLFGAEGTDSTSVARNTLRRLVRCQLVFQTGKGRYKIASAGRGIIPQQVSRPVVGARLPTKRAQRAQRAQRARAGSSSWAPRSRPQVDRASHAGRGA